MMPDHVGSRHSPFLVRTPSASNYKALHDHEAAVRAWWNSVPERKKRDWVSARAIYRQWQKSLKPPTTEPKRNDKQVIKELENQVRDLAGQVDEVTQERDTAHERIRELETTQQEPMWTNGTDPPSLLRVLRHATEVADTLSNWPGPPLPVRTRKKVTKLVGSIRKALNIAKLPELLRCR